MTTVSGVARPASDMGDFGGIHHQMPDVLTKGIDREIVSLPQRSLMEEAWRSPSGEWPPTWWRREDPYWGSAFEQRTNWITWRQWSGKGDSWEDSDLHALGMDDAARTEMSLEEIAKIDEACRVFSLMHLVGVSTVSLMKAVTGADNRVLRLMFRAGLLETCWFHARRQPRPRVNVWRLLQGAQQMRMAGYICNRWGAERAFLGTAPLSPVRTGIQHVAHQSLSLELMLRCLESADQWAGWLPEGACHSSRIVRKLHPARAGKPNLWADGCLVRRDGGRVFLETSVRTTKEKAAEKVAKWSELLSGGYFGGLVLFVATSPPHGLRAAVRDFMEAIEKTAPPRAQSHMLLGVWTDYSPDRNQITEADGQRLRAIRYDGSEWAECDALTSPIELADEAIVGRLPDALTTPTWAGGRAG